MTTITPAEIAPIRRRVIAYVIDALIAGVLPTIGTIVMASVAVAAVQSPENAAAALVPVAIAGGVFGLLMLAWFVIYTVMQTGRGSIGMRAQRIRLIGAVDGSGVTFWRALLRNIVFAITGSFVVGMFSPLFDGSGRYQGWHDKVAGAVMVDAAADTSRSAAAPAPHRAAPPAPVPGAPAPPPGAPAAPAPDANAARPAPPLPFPEPTRAAPPLPDAAPDETIVAPRPRHEAPADELISFVPGVSPAGAAATPPAPSAPVAPPAAEPAAPAAAPPAPPVSPAPSAPPVPPTAPPAPPAPAAAVTPTMHSVDESDDDVESTRISIPGHRLVFTWDDGQRVTVSGRTVFGRNPEQEAGAVVIAVRDETLSLSKTHFEAASEPSGGWVMDRQSTNGTIVVRDGVRIACPPGQRIPIRLGDAIEIGDRIVTIGGFA